MLKLKYIVKERFDFFFSASSLASLEWALEGMASENTK